MRQRLLLTTCFFIILANLSAQVGIGTTTPNPSALLHLDAATSLTKGFLITGTFNTGATLPNLGAGSRLMFYPGKAAFRAGYATGTEWDDSNVGKYSVALGYTTLAFGDYSLAAGYQSTAQSNWSTAIGTGAIANNLYATSIGSYNTANGWSSMAIGTSTKANGDYSFSLGTYSQANGAQSIAMGSSVVASGLSSTAIGIGSVASGGQSIAIGNNTVASAASATAIGNTTTAGGPNSLAMGYNTTASNASATAFGNTTIASGVNSTSMGYNTTASGAGSTALGSSVSTNGQTGAFIIGDNDPGAEGVTRSGGNDQFVARFWNGYYLLTSGDVTRSGVSIAHNGNSWVSICDKNRKENFEPVNGEDVLHKLNSIPFTSWNYKMQDPKAYRHYGIMAQDFNAAFGHDKYGAIGNDTTVNPIDMIGIDMTAIQALIKRTNDLKKENEDLRQLTAQLQISLNEQAKLVAQRLKQLELLTSQPPAKRSIAKK